MDVEAQDTGKAATETGKELEFGEFGGAFTDKSVRMQFIRKVYGLLSVCLLITFGFVLLFTLNDTLGTWARSNIWIALVSCGISLALVIAMVCCGLDRKYPVNLYCLFGLSIVMGISLGVVSAFSSTMIVLLAMGITAVVVISLTLFAMQTKIDFTVYRGLAFVLLIILIVMGIILIFWRNRIAHVIYSGMGALLFSFYILIDTQSIMGGRSFQFDPEDYVRAVLHLYLDIINLFMFILNLLNATQ